MDHGLVSLISSGALGLALLAGAPSQDDRAYFPLSLREMTMNCADFGPGSRRAVLSDFAADWYGRHLRAAGEAPLFAASGPTLRFTLLRSFQAPVVIRLDTAADGTMTMTATELSGKGGFEPGTVARRIERRLSAREAAAVRRVLEETAVLAQEPGECSLGLDGAQWIVESAGPEGYRFVNRWSPGDGPVRELGVHLIGLTRWRYRSLY
ncbi:MAG TPA: hypothetical protein VN018_06720 [Brevundimonas sp.]|nr:hypothetical protein [Brevundimonas sp.]